MKQVLAFCTVFSLVLGVFALPTALGATENALPALSMTPLYRAFTGTVEKVDQISAEERAAAGVEATQYVLLRAGDESLLHFVVSDATVLLNEPVLEVGQQLVGFFDGNRPAILIYPPQVPALVITPYVEGEQVVMSYFDANLLSSDSSLQLNIGDSTEIIDQAGQTYDGNPAERVLVVTYGPSTRSIPAQTTPIQILVMDEVDNGLTYVVNGIITEASAPYEDAQGTVMVPLMTIAEALELLVTEEGEGVYRVGNQATLTLGKDSYTFARMAPYQLGSVPVEMNGEIYVPLAFFSEVGPLANTYVYEGQIIIDNK